MICQGLPLCGGPLSQYQVRQAVSGFISPAAEYHLHRKTHILPCELAKCCTFCDLSVGYAMFFSRRWILCCRTRNTTTARLICCCYRYHLHMKSDSSLRCLTLTTNHRYSPPDLFFLTHKSSKKQLSYGIIIPYIFRTFI